MTRSQRSGDGERILAVFIDFENVGLGFGGRRDRFSIEKVLERLVEKGKIVAKKAYADWSRFGMYAGMLHAAAVELVEIPKRSQTGKNSADIRMCVDAMDLAYSKDHIDTFVIVSGDSDFSPLVSKLKELGKHVIGLGLVDSTSDLLRDNCDEFIYYEDLDRAPNTPLMESNQAIPETKRKAFTLLLDSLLALRRENKEVIYSSMLKDTMKRKKPSFNEEYHGYRSFTELLEDAQRYGFIEIERHKNSGTFVITQTGTEGRAAAPALPTRPTATPKPLALPPKPAVAAKPPAAPARPQPAPVEPRGGSRRGASGPRAAAAPARLPAPPIENNVEDEERLPLGRELIEDVDILDEELGTDEVPSYMPRKAEPPAAKPPARPAKTTKPASAARAKVEPKPAPQPNRRASERRPEEPRAPRKPEKPPAKPAPPSDEDAEFGAGLDL